MICNKIIRNCTLCKNNSTTYDKIKKTDDANIPKCCLQQLRRCNGKLDVNIVNFPQTFAKWVNLPVEAKINTPTVIYIVQMKITSIFQELFTYSIWHCLEPQHDCRWCIPKDKLNSTISIVNIELIKGKYERSLPNWVTVNKSKNLYHAC